LGTHQGWQSEISVSGVARFQAFAAHGRQNDPIAWFSLKISGWVRCEGVILFFANCNEQNGTTGV